MTHGLHVDPTFEAWLEQELDAVTEPTRAVEGAVNATASIRQREPLLRRLRRLFGSADPRPPRVIPPPETILWADTSSRQSATRGAAPALPANGVIPVPLAMVAVTLVALLGAAALLVTLGPGSVLLGGATPGSTGPTAAPALLLDPPRDGGRDLFVASDGSGHFWTITDAVAGAQDGDRIHVEPGTYRESVVVSKDVTITGAGDRDDVIIRPSEATEAAGAAGRFVIELDQSDATISGLTILGSRIGVAIVVRGGAPTLDDLVIDAEGSQIRSNPTDARQAIAFSAGSTGTLSGSHVTAFIEISDGGAPSIDGNTLVGTCIRADGAGVAATIQNNILDSSACPGFSIAVSGGARSTLVGNKITNPARTDGIRVMGPGSSAQISSHVISGGDYGIWIGSGAAATITRSLVSNAVTGVRVGGADAVLDTLDVRYNETGLLIDDGAAPNLVDNVICENGLNVDQRIDPAVSEAGNHVTDPCPEDTIISAGL